MGFFSHEIAWPELVSCSTVIPTETPDGERARAGERPMNSVQQIDATDYDRPTQLQWMEDFEDLSVDDLRELPNHMQLGLDLSVFD